MTNQDMRAVGSSGRGRLAVGAASFGPVAGRRQRSPVAGSRLAACHAPSPRERASTAPAEVPAGGPAAAERGPGRRAPRAAARPPPRRRPPAATPRPPAPATAVGRHRLIGREGVQLLQEVPGRQAHREAQPEAGHRARRSHLLDLVDHLQAVPAARDHPGQQQEGHHRRARADHAGGGLPALPGGARLGGADRGAVGQVPAHHRDHQAPRRGPIPLYGEDGDMPQSESYVTRLIRVENADANEVAQVLGRLKGEQGDVIVFAPQGALIITDPASNITRMLRILRARSISPAPARRSGSSPSRTPSPPRWHRSWREIFQVAQLGGKKGAPRRRRRRRAGAAAAKAGDLTTEMMISKIIPDERSNQLIVIANERAYARVLSWCDKLDVPHRGRRRPHPRLLLRERQLRRAGADPGRGHRRRGHRARTARPRTASRGVDADAAAGARRRAARGRAAESAVRGGRAHQLRSPHQLADHRVVAEGLPVAAPGDRAARFAAQAGLRRGDDPGGHARQAARARRLVARRQAAEPVRAERAAA